MFIGKRRRDAPCVKSQSVDSFFRFGGDDRQVKIKRQKRRMEEWDAKGGFNIPRGPNSSKVRSKTITDVEMELAFGVVPDEALAGNKGNKRRAITSASQDISKWIPKKNKTTSPTRSQEGNIPENLDDDMIIHLSLAVGNPKNAISRDVVDPNQPQNSS